jgi:hypothetical protein
LVICVKSGRSRSLLGRVKVTFSGDEIRDALVLVAKYFLDPRVLAVASLQEVFDAHHGHLWFDWQFRHPNILNTYPMQLKFVMPDFLSAQIIAGNLAASQKFLMVNFCLLYQFFPEIIFALMDSPVQICSAAA